MKIVDIYPFIVPLSGVPRKIRKCMEVSKNKYKYPGYYINSG
ncbi:MAG: hypothetical protein ACFFFB_20650 [Candidatus Heimdallarchaeota archaeon]